MLPALAASVAAPIVGGLVGNLMSQGDRAKQRKMMSQALEELKAAGLPPDLSKEIIYQQFQQVGILTPELEQELNLAESETAKIKEDSKLRDSQTQALDLISKAARTGLRPEDRAALNDIRQSVQRDAEAKRQQIMSSMAARGMGGSGSELLAQLSAGQEANERASREGLQIGADASKRALEMMQRQADVALTVS